MRGLGPLGLSSQGGEFYIYIQLNIELNEGIHTNTLIHMLKKQHNSINGSHSCNFVNCIVYMLTVDNCILCTLFVLDIFVLNCDQSVQHMHVCI